MQTFIFALNCQVDAKSIEEALVIAQVCKDALTDKFSVQPYKIEIDIDRVEEL